jgi:cytosine/adenosine deaminase-related metal-dependent hydrolase
MPCSTSGGLTFINAEISGRGITSLRVLGSRIAALGGAPEAGDVVVDLHGDRVLPGLINAHDHLQLNSLPRLDTGKHYGHARAWISDINARRRDDAAFEAKVSLPRDQRLLLGGVKNLLSGVTTVAHHDPLYALLSHRDYPVRVVADYGWSHSLYIDGEQKVRDCYRSTPSDWPWIIHAAEGVDAEAADEFERLEALDCIAGNTLIVHGIALDQRQQLRLVTAGAGLIWCPASNLRLFGRTAEVAALVARGRVALGTDSRLSGSRDMLDELRSAAECGGFDEITLEALATSAGARLLWLPDRGQLALGALADILILPARMKLSGATRADVRLVMVDGIARYGDEEYAQLVAPSFHWAPVRVDGRPKQLDRRLAAQLFDVAVDEDGLDLAATAWRAA